MRIKKKTVKIVTVIAVIAAAVGVIIYRVRR